MEESKTIDMHLDELADQVKSFKNVQTERLDDCDDRIKSLEKSHSLFSQRPSLSVKGNVVSENKKDFRDFLTKGVTTSREGFSLNQEIVDNFLDSYKMFSPMRRLASIDRISSDYATYIVEKNYVAATWVGKTASEPSDLNSGVKSIDIHVNDMCVYLKVAQRTIDDQAMNIERWIMDQAYNSFIRCENSNFIRGDGDGKPLGLLHANIQSDGNKPEEIISAEAVKINVDDLQNLYYRLPTEYAANATFLMHKKTIQKLRSIKYKEDGQYIWQPSLHAKDPDTLLGIPVIECSDMPEITTGAYPVALGDFKRAYRVVDRNGVNILRDPYSSKPYVSFYITKKVGGGVMDNRAVVLLKIK